MDLASANLTMLNARFVAFRMLREPSYYWGSLPGRGVGSTYLRVNRLTPADYSNDRA